MTTSTARRKLPHVQRRVMVALSEGDLAAARCVMAAGTAVPHDELTAGMAVFWDLGWVLEEADQQHVLTLGPVAFDDDRGTWAIVRTQLYAWRGDTAQSRVWADTAARHFATQLAEAPQDPQRHIFLALALAYRGRRAAAERGLARARATPDASSDPYYHHLVARIYLLLGDRARALDELKGIMRVPYFLTAGWLRIDPSFAGLRGDVRFERLVAGT